jgi:hypothetical protein
MILPQERIERTINGETGDVAGRGFLTSTIRSIMTAVAHDVLPLY